MDYVEHGAVAAVAGGAIWVLYLVIKKILDDVKHQIERLGDKVEALKDRTIEVHTEMGQIRRQSDG